MVDSSQISDAEWHVMTVVWQRQPVDAQTVIGALAESNGWSISTVKTMLHRLVKKGILSFKQDGKRYLYRAQVRRADCIRQASRSFLDRVFGSTAAPALFQLVKAANLKPDEVAELRRLLENKDG